MEFLKGDGDGGGFEAALVSPFEASLAIAIRSFLNAWDPKNGQNSQFTIKSTKTHKLYNSFNSSQTNPHPIDLDLHHNQNPEKKNLFFQKFSSINKKEKEREYQITWIWVVKIFSNTDWVFDVFKWKMKAL